MAEYTEPFYIFKCSYSGNQFSGYLFGATILS
jgi:hypothetical protein